MLCFTKENYVCIMCKYICVWTSFCRIPRPYKARKAVGMIVNPKNSSIINYTQYTNYIIYLKSYMCMYVCTCIQLFIYFFKK